MRRPCGAGPCHEHNLRCFGHLSRQLLARQLIVGTPKREVLIIVWRLARRQRILVAVCVCTHVWRWVCTCVWRWVCVRVWKISCLLIAVLLVRCLCTFLVVCVAPPLQFSRRLEHEKPLSFYGLWQVSLILQNTRMFLLSSYANTITDDLFKV